MSSANSRIWNFIYYIKPQQSKVEVVEKIMVNNAGTICAAGGAACAIPATGAAITALGFAGSGITGGSVAAGMMSSAAIANGGGVAAGSVVALLQSVGVLGVTSLGVLPVVGIGVAGAGIATGCYYGGKVLYNTIKQPKSKL
ncbi:unnamed protein product [Didymodactylos carnosus]|uniref:Uncharacterized protein n=1 Tax=Didymodactylos carnosus TaxID=1234261 RepID=A0A815VSR2_9BILA|nr:unnamed protein product [Didymodactylos carnosus]CAF1534342.1 unnamed protein product [Didymodactylos carnosus]CAF4023998.1 unnamed protein product [Didymodactylos carnosus]CAF4394025.1 unnamed protein product [Didymodactylos carnosus]